MPTRDDDFRDKNKPLKNSKLIKGAHAERKKGGGSIANSFKNFIKPITTSLVAGVPQAQHRRLNKSGASGLRVNDTSSRENFFPSSLARFKYALEIVDRCDLWINDFTSFVTSDRLLVAALSRRNWISRGDRAPPEGQGLWVEIGWGPRDLSFSFFHSAAGILLSMTRFPWFTSNVGEESFNPFSTPTRINWTVLTSESRGGPANFEGGLTRGATGS